MKRAAKAKAKRSAKRGLFAELREGMQALADAWKRYPDTVQRLASI
jgi:hypothetical protein